MKILLYFGIISILVTPCFGLSELIWERIKEVWFSSYILCSANDQLLYCKITDDKPYQELFKGSGYAKHRYEYIKGLQKHFFSNSSIVEYNAKNQSVIKPSINSFTYKEIEYYIDLKYYQKDSNANSKNQMCIYKFDEKNRSEQALNFRNCPWKKGTCTYSDREIRGRNGERINWTRILDENGTEISGISYGCKNNQLCCGLECCDMINAGVTAWWQFILASCLVIIIYGVSAIVKKPSTYIVRIIWDIILSPEKRNVIDIKLKSVFYKLMKRKNNPQNTGNMWNGIESKMTLKRLGEKFSDADNELKLLVDKAKQYTKSGRASADEIRKLLELMNKVKNKLTEAKDIIPMLMQFPDFNSMKITVLTLLSKFAATSPQLPHGLASTLFEFVFFFCVNCQKYSFSVIDQFTAPEKEQLKNDMFIAIPHLESNLKDTFDKLNEESVAEFRCVRSGLQFLQENIVFQLKNQELNARMVDLLRSKSVQEINGRLDFWKEKCVWDPNEHLDLRFIPSSHNWWLEEQRKASRDEYGSNAMEGVLY